MTTTKYNLRDFAQAAENAGGTYYGFYGGRFWFRGYAATFDNRNDMRTFAAELTVMGMKDLLRVKSQEDDMGKGVVVAYDENAFDLETDPRKS